MGGSPSHGHKGRWHTIFYRLKMAKRRYIRDLPQEEIRQRYVNGEMIKNLAREYQFSRNSIETILKGLIAGPRSTEINDRYFDKIDSAKKAYWLGMLYADGCVTDKGSIILVLSGDSDLHVLEEFKKDLNYSGPVRAPKMKECHKLQPYRLDFQNPRMAAALVRLGCFPRKSLALQFPNKDQVPEEYMKDFLRGYFDGDGSVSVIDRNLEASITSSIDFCLAFQEYIKKTLNISCFFKRQSNSGNVQFSCRMAVLFLDYLYHNAEFRMNRKYEKFKQYIIPYVYRKTSCGSPIDNKYYESVVEKWKSLFKDQSNADLYLSNHS